ncbi:MAG: hypothetical protein ACJA1C_000067 [Crocinitomicaceae bacterium]|jgi:hypothetical protein
MSQNFTNSLRSVATQVEANEIVLLLLDGGIQSKIIKESFSPAATFSGGSLSSNYEILIQETDAENARSILKENARLFLSDVDSSHYLFSFTDQELRDVLVKNHEWSEFDVLLSEKILEDRSIAIDKKKIQEENFTTILDLSQPKKGILFWIVVGYIFAFLGGLIGLIISYTVIKVKRKLPDGTKMYEYDESTRKHATIIFIISCVVFALSLGSRILFY